MKFQQIPWKFDKGFGMWGCWYGDLIVRYFIWPANYTGKFQVKVGFGRLVGEYTTLVAAKKAAQLDLERTVMAAIVH